VLGILDLPGVDQGVFAERRELVQVLDEICDRVGGEGAPGERHGIALGHQTLEPQKLGQGGRHLVEEEDRGPPATLERTQVLGLLRLVRRLQSGGRQEGQADR
jgi:hypothetical protein